VNPLIMTMTPMVPPSTASTPTPKVTSAMSRSTSWREWMTVCGIQPTARRWKASGSPILSMASTGWRTIARNLARRTPMSVRIAMSRPLRRDDLEVHRREDEIGEEQEEEGHHDAQVDRVADPLRTALGVHAA